MTQSPPQKRLYVWPLAVQEKFGNYQAEEKTPSHPQDAALCLVFN